MKIKLEGETPGAPGFPKYILQPENQDECRFLTILRNVCVRADMQLVVIGSVDCEEKRPGLPDRAVLELALGMKSSNGTPIKEGVHLDPSRPMVDGTTIRRSGRRSEEIRL